MTSRVPTTDALFPSQWLEVAERICARYYAEFPDHAERFGERGQEYCAHDNAYLIAWLVDDMAVPASGSFARNVTWLASVLDARGFPMDAFRRNLELVGDAVVELRPDDAVRIGELVAAARASVA